MTHSRFDNQHRQVCADCREAYEDFLQEQADEARLDAMSEELETV